MHAHVLPPAVLVQVALLLHPPLLLAHSFTSLHTRPSPEYPLLHTQVRPPLVLVQVASLLQPPLLVAHSLMSRQTPLTQSNPVVQPPQVSAPAPQRALV